MTKQTIGKACPKCRNTGYYHENNSMGLSSCDCEYSKLGYSGGMG